MPMGTAASLGWSQGIVRRVCDGLDRIGLFIDDLIAHFRDGQEHVRHPVGLFERLTFFDLMLAARKAHLGVREVKFMGRRVNGDGIVPGPGKVGALTKIYPCPLPKVLPQMAANTKPLRALLKKGVAFEMTPSHVEVVQAVLARLSGPDVLAFPGCKLQFRGLMLNHQRVNR